MFCNKIQASDNKTYVEILGAMIVCSTKKQIADSGKLRYKVSVYVKQAS